MAQIDGGILACTLLTTTQCICLTMVMVCHIISTTAQVGEEVISVILDFMVMAITETDGDMDTMADGILGDIMADGTLGGILVVGTLGDQTTSQIMLELLQEDILAGQDNLLEVALEEEEALVLMEKV